MGDLFDHPELVIVAGIHDLLSLPLKLRPGVDNAAVDQVVYRAPRTLAMLTSAVRLILVVPVSMLLMWEGDISNTVESRSCVMSALIRAILIRFPRALSSSSKVYPPFAKFSFSHDKFWIIKKIIGRSRRLRQQKMARKISRKFSVRISETQRLSDGEETSTIQRQINMVFWGCI